MPLLKNAARTAIGSALTMLFEDWATVVVLFLVYWWAQLGPSPSQDKDKGAGKFYQSPAWRKLRQKTLKENKAFFRNPGPTCERCGSHPGQWWRKILIGVGLANPNTMKWEVDHIKARSTHPALKLQYKNTQVLCKCHNLEKSNLVGVNWKALRRWGLGLLCPPLSVVVTLLRG